MESTSDDPILTKSIQLQQVENDWRIHVLYIKAKGENEVSSVGNSLDESKASMELFDKGEDDEDDDVVVIELMRQSQFCLDSLNPNRTEFLPRQRSLSTPSRNPLTSQMHNTSNRGSFSQGKKLPKTDAIKEEEILEVIKIHQKLAKELNQ